MSKETARSFPAQATSDVMRFRRLRPDPDPIALQADPQVVVVVGIRVGLKVTMGTAFLHVKPD